MVGPSTAAGHKANTSEAEMADIDLDAAEVNALLDIVLKTKDTVGLRAINEVALMKLSEINTDLEHQLRPPSKEELIEEEEVT